MNRKKLIKKYIKFFESKDHKEIPNSSLVPENDSSVLFTTAGMHPLVPFLLGEKHPQGKKLVGVQRCIRTGDIEEVGDEVHHTFFEMLGNWSLGDYWKQETIEMSFDFLTKKLKIPKEKIFVTCFEGDKDVVKDEESSKIWKKLGIEAIEFKGKKDNWWGPAGETGPCGPDSEMFVNGVEIWNDVFMQYNKDANGKYNESKQKNIDTGMGVERTVAILNDLKDNYLGDSFKPIINKIEKISKKKYQDNLKVFRIIADHIKASVFILGDGITPSNTGHGYVLRRLIRRAVKYGRDLDLIDFTEKIAEPVFDIYDDYEILKNSKEMIISELNKEEKKFNSTLEKGLNVFEKFTKGKQEIDPKKSFLLYQSYGFPVEMIEEECKKNSIDFSREGFDNEIKSHQELSRTASAGMFKSGLADESEKTIRLHTSAHLLLAALKVVLKDDSIIQKGSNINPERIRFDFSFPRKIEQDELYAVEDLVNKWINGNYDVIREEMTLDEARKVGAAGIFDEKYKGQGLVSVYSIDKISKELCTGPHVKNTKEIGVFRIKKQESSGAGVRRVKCILE
jgi:alanyl-tRNA synthetase